ncbi:MAG: UvrB/UvrC motif-containing protein [Candidatus Omnitrophica bacterium]|nr:UvrB/UvrC motif-containing protein [Candidatus Omnitrophota bacterium]
MLCDLCGKNEATVHLTEIIDNQVTELHLCEECARNKSIEMEQQFGLGDLLAGLAEFGKGIEETESSRLKCSKCGISYEDFKKIGKLGCSQCYITFKRYLSSLLKKIHGSNKHIGKTPLKVTAVADKDKKNILEDLRQKLQKAIEAEEFEEAARIRDQIRELEKVNRKNENR